MTKQEYLGQLKEKLSAFDDGLAKEILGDYEGHFREGLENGKCEEAICKELGTVDEIIEELLQLYQPKKKAESSFNSTVNEVVNDALHLANNITNTIVKGIKSGIDYGKQKMNTDWPKDNVVDSDCTKESSETCSSVIIEAFTADVYLSPSDDERFHLEYINHGGLKDKMFYHFTGDQKADTYYGKLIKEQGNSSLFSKLSTPHIEIKLKIPREFKLIEIKTTSGDLTIERISVEEGRFYTSSGDISINEYKSVRHVSETANGDITLKQIKGEDIKVYTKSGDISISSCKSETGECDSSSGDITGNHVDMIKLTVKSSSGDIRMENMKADTIDFHTQSGDVWMKNAETKVCTASTASGDMEFETVSAETMNLASSSGDATAAGKYSNCCIQTSSGDIKVCAEGNINAQFHSSSGDVKLKMKSAEGGYIADVSAVSGDISLQYGTVRKYELPSGNYTMGEGSSKIQADSVSGDITIQG